jgi:uncharacterized protein (DUF302 family)
MTTDIGFEIQMAQPYDKALDTTKEALKVEGFGVLTEIDVKSTMKDKLDIDFRPYSILGACNPPLAYRALSEEAEAGLLLPCNVTVEAEDQEMSTIRITNPRVLLGVSSMAQNPELMAVADEARARLERVAEALSTS